MLGGDWAPAQVEERNNGHEAKKASVSGLNKVSNQGEQFELF